MNLLSPEQLEDHHCVAGELHSPWRSCKVRHKHQGCDPFESSFVPLKWMGNAHPVVHFEDYVPKVSERVFNWSRTFDSIAGYTRKLGMPPQIKSFVRLTSLPSEGSPFSGQEIVFFHSTKECLLGNKSIWVIGLWQILPRHQIKLGGEQVQQLLLFGILCIVPFGTYFGFYFWNA